MNYLKQYVGDGKPISYEQLGQAFGVTRQQAGNMIRKPIREWPIKRLQTIAQLLHYDINELFVKCLIFETKKERPVKKEKQTA